MTTSDLIRCIELPTKRICFYKHRYHNQRICIVFNYETGRANNYFYHITPEEVKV